MYETYCIKPQPYFAQESIQSHYIDTEAFVLSRKTSVVINEIYELKDLVDFSNLNKDHELLSNENEKVVDILKNRTPKNYWIDKIV